MTRREWKQQVVVQRIIGLLFLMAYFWMESAFQGEDVFWFFLIGLALILLDKPLEQI